jgi:hypothetical protein
LQDSKVSKDVKSVSGSALGQAKPNNRKIKRNKLIDFLNYFLLIIICFLLIKGIFRVLIVLQYVKFFLQLFPTIWF